MNAEIPQQHLAAKPIPPYGGVAPNVLILSDNKKPYKSVVPGLLIMGEE